VFISWWLNAIPIHGFVVSPTQQQSRHFPGKRCVGNFREVQPLLFVTITAESVSNDEKVFIRESLLQNTLFTGVPEFSLDELILGFEKVRYDAVGLEIVRQGDFICDEENYFVYLVGENSECTVTVDGNLVPEPYGTLRERAMFGDLAVLYNETRAATISVKSESGVALYRVDGDSYKNIVLNHARKESSSSSSQISLEEMQEIDEVINQISGSTTLYSGNIIPPYQPERLWLWRQWSGTILKVSYQIALLNMLFCLVFTVYADYCTVPGDDNMFSSMSSVWTLTIPDSSLPFNERLSLLKEIWNYQRDLTIFILTFFLNQAFSFWKDTYNLARSVQGRLNDIMLVIATNVKRNPEDGSLTEESEQLLDDIGRYIRLFHVLFWASTAKRFACLLTPAGLERMSSRNKMTARELEVLQSLDVPGNRLDSIPLEWLMIRANQAVSEGILASDTSTKTVLLQQVTKLRAACKSIEDMMDGRMPLAYVNLVQLLVDTFVVIAPFALYADLGNYAVFAVGILTLFYTGLLNLAKIFLDPLNNEAFCENSVFMDLGVLIRETNSDTIKWKSASKQVPF
jgi:hypothetical protein